MEKKLRASAKGKFTRQEKHLTELLDDVNSAKVIVTPQFDKFVDCWNKLEDAQDAFIAVTEINVEEDADGIKYLDDISARYRALVKRYAEFLKKANTSDQEELQKIEESARASEETSRKQIETEKRSAEEEFQKQQRDANFLSIKAELETSIDSFKTLTAGLKDSVTNSSDSLKRQELGKVDNEFTSLKGQLAKLAGVDSTKDISEIKKKFVDDAESTFLDFHKAVAKDIKDTVTSGGSSASDKSTKKEVVKLPKFVGDESSSPSPFLTFPIWLKQWKGMITDYDEKYRDRMLCDHIDATACSKFVGFESDYEEAMKRLEQFYGDSSKVVKCVMTEVKSQDSIADEDYSSLVEYSNTLEHNYNRLTSMSLQHEMSNTSVMSVIVRRFPKLIEERWHEHILDKSDAEKAQPFPVFIQWLSRQKLKWACMVSSELSATMEESLYVGDHRSGGGKECYGCGEAGHIQRNCPKKQKDRGGNSKPRQPPKVKQFWCALHKDLKSRKCFSNACVELRKMTDIARRISLIRRTRTVSTV